jgi:hypothetical protein
VLGGDTGDAAGGEEEGGRALEKKRRDVLLLGMFCEMWNTVTSPLITYNW